MVNDLGEIKGVQEFLGDKDCGRYATQTILFESINWSKNNEQNLIMKKEGKNRTEWKIGYLDMLFLTIPYQ